MRQTPVTSEFFDQELLPLFADVLVGLLDDSDLLDGPNALIAVVDPRFKSVTLTVQLPREHAARIIGKEHSTRMALAHVFSSISKNHGYAGGCKFIIIGLHEDGTVATNSDIFMPRPRVEEERWTTRRRRNG